MKTKLLLFVIMFSQIYSIFKTEKTTHKVVYDREDITKELIKTLRPTPCNVYNVCLYYDIKHPDIVTAQSVLETGWYKRYKNNNILGLYNSNKNTYYSFNHWSESIVFYRDIIQEKYSEEKHKNYFEFLVRLPYAEDSMYVSKIKNIINKLENNGYYRIDNTSGEDTCGA